MKSNVKTMLGIVIVIVILAGAYFAFGSSGGFSITGAFSGAKECVTSDAKAFYNACVSWKNSGWENRPRTLKVLTTTSARTTCDKLLREYKLC